MTRTTTLILTLSDEEFVVSESEFLSLHSVLCDSILDNCHRCGELCCPEGQCGLGGGWIQTYRATYYQPAEHEPSCVSHDPEANGFYDDGDY